MAWTQPIRAAEPPPLQNDLQEVVEPETQTVQAALRLLSSLEGTLGVAMSGSGPSCFALFADPTSCAAAQATLEQQLVAEGLQSWCCNLRPNGVRIEA
jgi:4-diphosphocytidyl-2-C-methyl-D-erythritol kinase